MNQIVLEASNLSVRYKHRLLFHIPSLKICRGDAIYLTGPNGIGKTSLLKVLAGIQKPTTGKLNLRRPSFMQRLAGFSGHSDVIYMHQSAYLFDGTVADNVAYGLKSRPLCPKERRMITMQALQMIGLEHLSREHISVLSGGEKQKVAMARAWALSPSILLMDESCANLDPNAIDAQRMMVEDLLKRGASLVITSHHPNSLTACCNQHWLIENQSLVCKPILNIINKDNHAFAF
ncbi:ABC transporter ATP-binding protein [Grimontia hollisae]|uniref:ABC-type tungstate transport system ATP-binding protein n=1 Tax=Grimontia hollisae CIP 101886 TaxID=675812 RepID=D0IBN8_GRIHO|nr:energy-coupling factor ABC transporter ATP-binding protein [Grimontia hollisae]AMG29688.1 ABC transporter ATP-binding protein [Grimontia hollisae]EEY71306.1 ABC-type tungstate transport system ATP-binding protein [Grimontia hollisae CIP 101886]STO43590.1 Lipopolysaccharide export system ATP-binding protein LptB [Grimontia hollisae]